MPIGIPKITETNTETNIIAIVSIEASQRLKYKIKKNPGKIKNINLFFKKTKLSKHIVKIKRSGLTKRNNFFKFSYKKIILLEKLTPSEIEKLSTKKSKKLSIFNIKKSLVINSYLDNK